MTLTVVSECGPECGAMAWLVSADPADAVAEWIDGVGGQTSCASYSDPTPDETPLHVRLRCNALGPVTFRVEGVSPRGTLCQAECTIQVNSCVDLDVDSNNDNVIDPVNGPEGTDDPIEDAHERHQDQREDNHPALQLEHIGNSLRKDDGTAPGGPDDAEFLDARPGIRRVASKSRLTVLAQMKSRGAIVPSGGALAESAVEE
ncbi:MAG: hypothetical protein BroJett003_22360 [Planctomycetota bacterium]|nr:MAG: hypothetical protein BroJett003_22360 [Planctomycetota bacterium]